MGTTKLKSILIDDSQTQRIAVRKLIQNHYNLDLIGDFESCRRATKSFTDHRIDLIFLDIEMPEINGFEFIESLKVRPQIILITAKAEYAMQAFDYDVTDYLLKPITPIRFNTSVKKALFKHSDEDAVEDDFIFVNSQLKKVKVFLKDIKWVEGLGDYIRVVTTDANLLVLSTMKSFLLRLPDDRFLRIHKSFIVNLERVENYTSSRVEVNGHQIPLSRHKKLDLEEALTHTENHILS